MYEDDNMYEDDTITEDQWNDATNEYMDWRGNQEASSDNQYGTLDDFGGDSGGNWNYDYGNMQDRTAFADNIYQQYGQALPGQQPQPPQEQGFSWGKLGTSALDSLGKSFQNTAQSASVPALAKLFANYMAAGQEKKSNNQMAQQIPQQVNQMRQQISPFDFSSSVDPNSMRGLAQTAFRGSMSDPYSPEIVQRSIKDIQSTQDRIDAKAGRRSNLAGSSALRSAQMAKIAMEYQNQLANQSGQGQYVGQQGLSDLINALKYGAQNNSPYFSALGQTLQGNNYTGNPNLQQAYSNQQAQYGSR